MFAWLCLLLVEASPAAELPPPDHPVLFIHGLNSNAKTWDQLKSFLHDHGWLHGGDPKLELGATPAGDSVSGVNSGDFYTMNMSDAGNDPPSQTLTFCQQGYEVAKVVEKIKSVKGSAKVILVGHSMGGLAARAYLEDFGAWDPSRSRLFQHDVSQLITIGTPHLGSPLPTILDEWPLAAALAYLKHIHSNSVAVKALAEDSDEIYQLNTRALPPDVDYASFIIDGTPIILDGVRTGDGIVPVENQSMAPLEVPGDHEEVGIVIYPDGLFETVVTKFITHTMEPEDLLVWSELIQRITPSSGLPEDLQLRVVANPDPIRPGECAELVYTVSNRGSTDFNSVELRMMTPPGIHWTPSDAAPSPDNFSSLYYPGEVARWDLGTLPAGTSRTVVVSGTVDDGYYAPPPDGALLPVTAMATADNGVSTADSAHLIVDYTSPLRVMLRGDRDPVQAGTRLKYVVSYGNPSTVSAPGTVLRVAVPKNTQLVSAEGGGVLPGGWVEWNLGTLGAGRGGTRRMTVNIDQGLPAGTLITGGAKITESGTGAMALAESTTSVNNDPKLHLQVAAMPNPVRPGEQVEMTFTLSNPTALDLA
ncbi:MAG: alpha/beta fold hydrolase, partial [Akkermansiaceae bacterium]|nr:alpha/beta fold hydrolase [Akkermansiaceae bacterium]